MQYTHIIGESGLVEEEVLAIYLPPIRIISCSLSVGQTPERHL
jgi:hypothetical protein